MNDSESSDLAVEIADHWKELLDCDDVSPDDFFLDLGGDSLLGTIFLNRIEDDFGFRPCLEFVFEHNFSKIVNEIKLGSKTKF
jgi:acyl carrier protein